MGLRCLGGWAQHVLDEVEVWDSDRLGTQPDQGVGRGLEDLKLSCEKA